MRTRAEIEARIADPDAIENLTGTYVYACGWVDALRWVLEGDEHEPEPDPAQKS